MGCRAVRPQGELLRVSRSQVGALIVGGGPGRGAWICADGAACVDLALRRKAFESALRGPVAPQALARLRMELAGRASMEGPPMSKARG